MQRVVVVDALCLHAQRTCLNNQQDIDALCVRRGCARNLWHRTEEFPGIFHGADRMAAVTVVPDILLVYLRLFAIKHLRPS